MARVQASVELLTEIPEIPRYCRLFYLALCLSFSGRTQGRGRGQFVIPLDKYEYFLSTERRAVSLNKIPCSTLAKLLGHTRDEICRGNTIEPVPT